MLNLAVVSGLLSNSGWLLEMEIARPYYRLLTGPGLKPLTLMEKSDLQMVAKSIRRLMTSPFKTMSRISRFFAKIIAAKE